MPQALGQLLEADAFGGADAELFGVGEERGRQGTP